MHYRFIILSTLIALSACGKDEGDGSAEGSSSSGSGTTQTDTPTGTDGTDGTTTGGTSTTDTTGVPTTSTTVDPVTTTGVDESTSTTSDDATTTDAASTGGSSTGGSTTGEDCATCSELIMGADPANVCPDSQDEVAAFQACVCNACMTECQDTCTMNAEPTAECSQCAQGAAVSDCGEELQACLADT